MTISRIILGVDGSPSSSRGTIHAAELAAGLGCPVLALHCFEPLSLLGKVAPPVDFLALRHQAERLLREEWTQPLVDAGVEFEARLLEGTPAQVLLDAAAAEVSPVVVVGSRGLNAVQEILLGSTTERLLSRLTCPVTVIPSA